VLTTRGARSGRERTVSSNGIADGDEAWLIVASNGGSARHPARFKNIQERKEAFRRISAVIRAYAGYQRKTDREIPVVHLTRISD
jgi:hypothetical protein